MKSISGLLSLGGFLFASFVVQAAEKRPDYSGQDVTKKNFKGERLDDANFEDAVAKEAIFDKAILKGANFQGADLSYARFAEADLTKADFRGARLTSTSFFQATMDGANLEKADLSRNGGLSRVKMRKANLRNLKAIGNCIEVDFSGADLRGANLSGMTMAGGPCTFNKAKYDSKTLWPKGFDVESSRAVLTEEAEEKPAKDDPKPATEKETSTKSLEKEFAALDKNEDGRLSGTEMKGLEDLDTNKDGRVTLEEFLAGRKK